MLELTDYYLERFLASFKEAIEWANAYTYHGNDFEEATEGAESWTTEAEAAARESCRDFLAEVAAASESWTEDEISEFDGYPEQAGRDFALTRNRHGAGFWDGHWSERSGKILTEISHHHGSFSILVDYQGTAEIFES